MVRRAWSGCASPSHTLNIVGRIHPNFREEATIGTINWTRVILGGLVAGVIIIVFEFLLNDVILANDMQAVIAALGKQMGGGALASFTAWGFLVGIFAVWLYAAIRARFGAGRATALCAAEPVWCLGYLVAAVTPFALNLFPARLLVIGLVVALVEVSVGTLAGAWIYREPTR